MWYSSSPARFWGCGRSRGASDDAALISMVRGVGAGVETETGLFQCSVASAAAAAAAASATARFKQRAKTVADCATHAGPF